MGELIRNQKGLQKLNVSIRSWGYMNPKITDNGVCEFFDAIT